MADDAELVERVRRRLAFADGTGTAPELALAVRRESGVLADEVALAEMQRGVAAEIAGAGPLEPLLALPGVTDVLVNGPRDVWLDRGRGLERTPIEFASDAAVRRLAQRLAATAGRRLDDATPFVDAALRDGTRLHAVLPPIAVHPMISLRVLGRRRFRLEELVLPEVEQILLAILHARLTVVVSGGTGTGKTTLLGAWLACVRPDERIVTIEDAPELIVAHPHVVGLFTRSANVEGSGVVRSRDLVRGALRMRPDRLVVGEFRGAEMVELLVALNTGHEGGAATLHANSAEDVPSRLIALGALGGLSPTGVLSQVANALDVVIHLRRGRDGIRHVDTIGLLNCGEDTFEVEPVWSAAGGVLSGAPALVRLLIRRGAPVPMGLR